MDGKMPNRYICPIDNNGSESHSILLVSKYAFYETPKIPDRLRYVQSGSYM